ncbi:hypothetical protein HanIR_Chr09g0435141 [Helianthus annuus]|nr:hypothetical protein HanIR_Chr09g0435141 [Helianthus annuus]
MFVFSLVKEARPMTSGHGVCLDLFLPGSQRRSLEDDVTFGLETRGVPERYGGISRSFSAFVLIFAQNCFLCSI